MGTGKREKRRRPSRIFRVDLPVKKLDELAKARMKTAKQLRKVEDKKGELYTLWKLCNIYSAVAVDVDEVSSPKLH